MTRRHLARAAALLLLPGILLASGIATGSESNPKAQSATGSSPSYPAVLTALTQGEEVELTVRFDQCTVAGATGPAVTSGLRINSFLAPRDKYVTFSDVHETLSPQNEKVTEYIRYKVTPDATLTVSTTSVVADAKPGPPTEFVCQIGKGAQFHWSN